MPHRNQKRNILTFLGAFMAGALCLLMAAPAALADGIPAAWGLGLQAPGSPAANYIDRFHNIVLVLITVITLFVMLLLLYVILRYNAWMNPRASRTAHNIKLEVIWTIVPCFILIALGCLSFPLLYYTDQMPTPDLTLKVTGHQWYWSYEYPDQGDIAFDSHAIWDSSDVTEQQAEKLMSESSEGWLIHNDPMRLLEVDNRVVLPVGEDIHVDITGGDVEHSWFMPALGVNRMAVPGRLSEVWLRIDHEGIYYGQCSMICGQGHGYMPIVIEGVSPEKFAAWVDSKKKAVGQGIFINAPQYAAVDKGNDQ